MGIPAAPYTPIPLQPYSNTACCHHTITSYPLFCHSMPLIFCRLPIQGEGRVGAPDTLSLRALFGHTKHQSHFAPGKLTTTPYLTLPLLPISLSAVANWRTFLLLG